MSMWANYSTEINPKVRFIEHDFGFVSYEFRDAFPGHIYIEDMYVLPDRRKSGNASTLLAEVAAIGRKHDCQWVLTSVNLRNELGAMAISLKAQLQRGFTPFSADGNIIWLRRSTEGIENERSSKDSK